MLKIPIKTKFDGVETDVVVTVRKFRVPHVEGAGPRVMLDDYSVAYPNGELVSAEVLDCNDTLALAELIEECILPAAEAVSPEQDVADKLGKSAGVIDDIVGLLHQQLLGSPAPAPAARPPLIKRPVERTSTRRPIT